MVGVGGERGLAEAPSRGWWISGLPTILPLEVSRTMIGAESAGMRVDDRRQGGAPALLGQERAGMTRVGSYLPDLALMRI